MKKLVIFSVFAVMAAGAAFAQVADGISISGGGDFAFAPLEVELYKGGKADGADSNDSLSASLGSPWGGPFGSASVTVKGGTEFVGFNVGAHTEFGSPNYGFSDNTGVWAKPFSFLQLNLGNYNGDTLRGTVGGPNGFDSFVLDSNDEDQIFKRFAVRTGAMLSLTPIDGLFVGVSLPTLPKFSGDALLQSADDNIHADDVYYKVQAGVGYTIEGIGHFRAQYVGAPRFDPEAVYTHSYTGWNHDNDTNTPDEKTNEFNAFKRAEVAFALMAIENMKLDIGVKIPFSHKYTDDADAHKGTFSAPFTASAGFDMTFGDVGVFARIDTFFGGGFDAADGDTGDRTNPFKLNFQLEPRYTINTVTIGLEAGMEMAGKSKVDGKELEKSDYFNFGIGLWAKQALGENGSIKAGVSFTSKEQETDHEPNAYIRIPIVVSTSF